MRVAVVTAALSAALFIGLLSLFATQAIGGGSGAQLDSPRARNLEAQYLIRSRQLAQKAAVAAAAASSSIQQNMDPFSAEVGVTSASSSSRTLSADFSHDTIPTTEASRAAAGCASTPRPYHTVLTSSSGGYQTWQCRVMYHHWKLQKRVDPCGEMGGFTRLLTSHNGGRDSNSFDEEIPTFNVKELRGGMAGGYVVANRPYSMMQFVQHPDFRKVVTEDYVYIAETDHVLLRPLPNLATETVPAAFNFGYMVAWGQAKIVDKFVPGLGGKTDPVGPSPVIIHVEQLKKMVQPWYDFTLKICNDNEAVQALGWVREMWGWCIAAGSLGIKHRVLDSFQYEGGSIGNRERPLSWPVLPVPVTPDRSSMPYYILHYTYGIEYSIEGLPMELQVGEWSLDKRHYMGAHPPRALAAPPKCAHDRAHVLSTLINNASATLANWPGMGGNTNNFHHLDLRGHPLRSHAVAAKLLGTGPWLLAGADVADRRNAFRLEKMWILTNGWLISSKGHGRWGLVANGGSASGYEPDLVKLDICNKQLVVRASFEAGKPWTLSDRNSGQVIATLDAPVAAIELWSKPPVTPTSELAARVEGSGPYRGGPGAFVLLRAGVLHVESGPQKAHTHWRVLDDAHRRDAIGLGGPEIEADPSKSAITADFTDCWVLRFPKAGSGGFLSETTPTGPPPKYGEGISGRSVEWIVQPPATLCKDVCAGLTLRTMTPEDLAGSVVARSVENCCGFSWSGFGGLKFLPNGELQTPWGKGKWGAPPEGQTQYEGKLVADFAGFKHLLSIRVEEEAGGKRASRNMESTRCNDNDRSLITVTDGEPRVV